MTDGRFKAGASGDNIIHNVTIERGPVTGPGQTAGRDCLEVQVLCELQHRDVPVNDPVVAINDEVLVSPDGRHAQCLLCDAGLPNNTQVIIPDSDLKIAYLNNR